MRDYRFKHHGQWCTLTSDNCIRYKDGGGYRPEPNELRKIHLKALLDGYNEPHIFKDDRDRDIRIRYMKEPAGRYLASLGMDPVHTESGARSVAEHAADRIMKLEAALKESRATLLNLSPQDGLVIDQIIRNAIGRLEDVL